MLLKLKGPWQWVASPLGFNMLLSTLEENSPKVEKYMQIANLLKEKEGFKFINKVFISSSHKNLLRKKKIKSLSNSLYSDYEVVDFSKNENAFTNYVNKYGQLRYHEFSSKTELIFANISIFWSTWQSGPGNGPLTMLYNSFSYTQDDKYEGRLLEMPLSSEFKLVLVLPNEADVLHTLFTTLSERGLAAAVRSIQPLFTAKANLKAPVIYFRSRVEVKDNISAISDGSAVQYGSIDVSEIGARVTVLTCFYSPAAEQMEIAKPIEHAPVLPYYFAVVFDDTPIFIGDLNKPLIFKKKKK